MARIEAMNCGCAALIHQMISSLSSISTELGHVKEGVANANLKLQTLQTAFDEHRSSHLEHGMGAQKTMLDAIKQNISIGLSIAALLISSFWVFKTARPEVPSTDGISHQSHPPR